MSDDPSSNQDAKPAAVPVKDEGERAIRDMTCEQLILTSGSTKSVNEIIRRSRIVIPTTGELQYPKSNLWFRTENRKRQDDEPISFSADGPKLGSSTPDAIALSSDEATITDDLDIAADTAAAQASTKTDTTTSDESTSEHAKAPTAVADKDESGRAKLTHTPPRLPPGVTPEK